MVIKCFKGLSVNNTFLIHECDSCQESALRSNRYKRQNLVKVKKILSCHTSEKVRPWVFLLCPFSRTFKSDADDARDG